MSLKNFVSNSAKAGLIFSLMLTGIAINAQEENQGASQERQHGSYMEINHAKKSAMRLIDINKAELARLKVIVANFGTDAQKNRYEELSNNFKEGYKELYKRKYLEAETILLQNRTDIVALLKEMADLYQNQAGDILNRCADQLVERELGIDPTSAGDPNAQTKVNRLIIDNNIRLLIAYDQLNMGDRYMVDEQYSSAIVHFRIAKMHGIQILIYLAETEEDREKIRDEFAKDLEDGNNRIK